MWLFGAESKEYWRDNTLQDLNVVDRPEFEKYINFLSRGEVDRNIKMLDAAQSRGGWSELSAALEKEHGYEASPNTIQFKAYDMQNKGIVDELNNWTEASQDVLDVYEFYDSQIDDLTSLLGACRSKGALAVFELCEEGQNFAVRDLSSQSGLHYSYFLQTSLPQLEDAELIEIDEISTYGEGVTKHPFEIVNGFLGGLEAVVDRHY